MSEIKLENFKKAVTQLNEAIRIYKQYKNDVLFPTVRNSLIKCFEIAFELSWKTLADFLRTQGVNIEQISPRAIIRKGFSAGYLKNEQLWLDLLDDRNNMVHIYRESMANGVAELINTKYARAMNELLGVMQ